MLVSVRDLVRMLRRIAVTVAGTVILAVGVVLLVALPLSGAGTGAGAAVAGLIVLTTVVYGVRELRRARQADTDGDDDPSG
jgi:hypothetical protein